MARKRTGSLVVDKRGSTTIYRARVPMGGRKYNVRLGSSAEGMTYGKAERALGHLMADVERSIWSPPAPEPEPIVNDPEGFHRYASSWWLTQKEQLRPNTHNDYEWRIGLLAGHFRETPVTQLDYAAVERYVAAQLARNKRIREAAEKGEPKIEKYTDKQGRQCERKAKPLSPRSINMTLTLLGAILEPLVETGTISHNPARGKRRRVKQRAPRRTYLDTAAQIDALLSAAGELDGEADKIRRHVKRRASLTTLAFAGLRIDELLSLRWEQVDLGSGWLRVADAKTDAGIRKVKIRPGLRDALAGVKADANRSRGLVFQTSTGKQMGADNYRNRVLALAVKRANENLEAQGQPPLPEGLTPHSLRRTFTSVLCAIGVDPGTVADELGHTDPTFTLRVYRQAMRHGEDEKAKLRALIEGTRLEPIGPHTDHKGADGGSESAEGENSEAENRQ